jgi:hypothetical protein
VAVIEQVLDAYFKLGFNNMYYRMIYLSLEYFSCQYVAQGIKVGKRVKVRQFNYHHSLHPYSTSIDCEVLCIGEFEPIVIAEC